MRVGTSGTPVARDVLATSAARQGDLADLGIDPDDLPDGLVVADENGRVICFNAAAARITAIPAARAGTSGL